MNQISPQSVGDCLIKGRFVDETSVDHRLRDCLSVEFDLVQDGLSLRSLKHAVLDKKLGELRFLHQLSSPSLPEITPSAAVRPASSLRTPSSRRVRIPNWRAL